VRRPAGGVLPLDAAGWRTGLVDGGDVGRDVKHHPVREGPSGCVGVADHERQSLGVGRNAGPAQGWRDVVTVAGIPVRDRITVGERDAGNRDRRRAVHLG
jgi:hypothetical protein